MEFQDSLHHFVVYFFSQVKNLRDKERKVSETCVLAPLNRAKEIWKVIQGDGCTSILGLSFYVSS